MGRSAAPCFRCNRIVEISETALVADIRLRTVGLEDAVRGSQASIYVCVDCTDYIAKGDEPNERTRPLDYLFCQQIKEIVTGDPSFTFLSWLNLRKTQGLPVPTLSEPKVLKAWNDFRKATALPALVERSDGEIPPPKRLAG